jgi:hypothetical protein
MTDLARDAHADGRTILSGPPPTVPPRTINSLNLPTDFDADGEESDSDLDVDADSERSISVLEVPNPAPSPCRRYRKARRRSSATWVPDASRRWASVELLQARRSAPRIASTFQARPRTFHDGSNGKFIPHTTRRRASVGNPCVRDRPPTPESVRVGRVSTSSRGSKHRASVVDTGGNMFREPPKGRRVSVTCLGRQSSNGTAPLSGRGSTEARAVLQAVRHSGSLRCSKKSVGADTLSVSSAVPVHEVATDPIDLPIQINTPGHGLTTRMIRLDRGTTVQGMIEAVLKKVP